MNPLSFLSRSPSEGPPYLLSIHFRWGEGPLCGAFLAVQPTRPRGSCDLLWCGSARSGTPAPSLGCCVLLFRPSPLPACPLLPRQSRSTVVSPVLSLCALSPLVPLVTFQSTAFVSFLKRTLGEIQNSVCRAPGPKACQRTGNLALDLNPLFFFPPPPPPCV